METIHLICLENQTTCFSMKCNTELKWGLKPGFFPCNFLYHKIRLQIDFFSEKIAVHKIRESNQVRKLLFTGKFVILKGFTLHYWNIQPEEHTIWRLSFIKFCVKPSVFWLLTAKIFLVNLMSGAVCAVGECCYFISEKML